MSSSYSCYGSDCPRPSSSHFVLRDVKSINLVASHPPLFALKMVSKIAISGACRMQSSKTADLCRQRKKSF